MWRRASSVRSGLLPAGGEWQAVIPSPEDPAPDHGVPSVQTFTMHAPLLGRAVRGPEPGASGVRPSHQPTQRRDAADPAGRAARRRHVVHGRQPYPRRHRGHPCGCAGRAHSRQCCGHRPRRAHCKRAPASPRRLDHRGRADVLRKGAGDHQLAWREHEVLAHRAAAAQQHRDTVDWFVFQSKRGWCEQIASALTIMLRVEGVPARVATGFATGTADPITGRYTVRERDAHAWTEVYFPGIGWQGFDPTSRVPLAGDPAPSRTLANLLGKHLSGMLELLGVIGLFSALLLFVWPRFAWRRARTRAARAVVGHRRAVPPRVDWPEPPAASRCGGDATRLRRCTRHRGGGARSRRGR